jgi:hypothetical protein
MLHCINCKLGGKVLAMVQMLEKIARMLAKTGAATIA